MRVFVCGCEKARGRERDRSCFAFRFVMKKANETTEGKQAQILCVVYSM